MDVGGVEARLQEVTDKFNKAKSHIAEQKAKLQREQDEADELQHKADDLVRLQLPPLSNPWAPLLPLPGPRVCPLTALHLGTLRTLQGLVRQSVHTNFFKPQSLNLS